MLNSARLFNSFLRAGTNGRFSLSWRASEEPLKYTMQLYGQDRQRNLFHTIQYKIQQCRQNNNSNNKNKEKKMHFIDVNCYT